MLPPFHGSFHCPLILDVESCQILFKIKALFIRPLNLLHLMTGISSRTSIRFVKHDLLCLGPCSLLSVKWLFPGVLLPQLLRMFPRTPSIPKQTRCYPCWSPISLLVLRGILKEIWRMGLAIFKSLGITELKWISVTASLPSLLILWLQKFFKGKMNSHVFSTALWNVLIECLIFSETCL